MDINDLQKLVDDLEDMYNQIVNKLKTNDELRHAVIADYLASHKSDARSDNDMGSATNYGILEDLVSMGTSWTNILGSFMGGGGGDEE